jgi:hypothetical protein
MPQFIEQIPGIFPEEIEYPSKSFAKGLPHLACKGATILQSI